MGEQVRLRLGSARSDVRSNVVSEELRLVAERELRERQQLERRHVSARYKTGRLLRLFQCDLLPGIGGQVLSSKASRDGSSRAAPAPAPAPVSVLAKGRDRLPGTL
jgi:hypothetical protein